MKNIPPSLPPTLKPDLTPEQIERRAEVAKRAAIIQAGIKPPKSGTFGKPPPSPKP